MWSDEYVVVVDESSSWSTTTEQDLKHRNRNCDTIATLLKRMSALITCPQFSVSLWRPTTTDNCGKVRPLWTVFLNHSSVRSPPTNKTLLLKRTTQRGDEDKEISGWQDEWWLSGPFICVSSYPVPTSSSVLAGHHRHLQSSSKLIVRMTGSLDKDTNK